MLIPVRILSGLLVSARSMLRFALTATLAAMVPILVEQIGQMVRQRSFSLE